MEVTCFGMQFDIIQTLKLRGKLQHLGQLKLMKELLKLIRVN